MNAYGISETGMVRANNEDSFFYTENEIYGLPNLFIVADGMGGHKAGEVASEKSIKYFREYCEANAADSGEILDFLIAAVTYSNNMVFTLSCSDDSYEGMGTTFSVCVYKGGKLYTAHIGDSRVYVINSGINQITADHTYVNEMVKLGQITEAQAKTHPSRNMLTRVLGSNPSALIDGYITEIQKNDRVLLCSDGLTNMIEDGEILSICKKRSKNEEAGKKMLKKAMDNGGFDNCTLILFDAN
ncbi:MAG: Stp1/IreP family PP2C-type Ser/Thr phosphatase [Clostridiales bacterium]|jgi:protein phosphatase|nr:Stp1/IreP family PP2C-type Ser/Thr phosphatase [Clostridiales bacterium]